MRRRPVKQEDSMGCGIACVAFVTSVSYNNAKRKYFTNENNADTIGYNCKDIVKALSISGKKYTYKYIKKRMKFKEGMIVFIKRSKHYPEGHYLVKTKNCWMDSWINYNSKNCKIEKARAGFRSRLPGTPIYVIFS